MCSSDLFDNNGKLLGLGTHTLSLQDADIKSRPASFWGRTPSNTFPGNDAINVSSKWHGYRPNQFPPEAKPDTAVSESAKPPSPLKFQSRADRPSSPRSQPHKDHPDNRDHPHAPTKQPVRCWTCHQIGHLKFSCPQTAVRTEVKSHSATVPPTDNNCVNEFSSDYNVSQTVEAAAAAADVGLFVESDSDDDDVYETDRIFIDRALTMSASCNSYQPAVKTFDVCENKVELSKLSTMSIFVNGVKTTCLIDSGSQITIIRPELVNSHFPSHGKIFIQPIVGKPHKANLIECTIARCNENSQMEPNSTISVVCAVLPLKSYDVLSPPKIADTSRQGHCHSA